VIANDGVNTGSGISAPFTLQRHAPVAHIDTPADGEIFPLNSQIILIGGARDAEDGGMLASQALTWLVDGQAVGSGKELALEGLAPGRHVITLRAVDSDGSTGTASVTITIAVHGMPVAAADFYTASVNTPLTIEAPGVLINDIDTEADPLRAVLVSSVSSGTLMLNSVHVRPLCQLQRCGQLHL
jgi:hypothetical protein